MALLDPPKGRCPDALSMQWTAQKELDLSVPAFKPFSFWGLFFSRIRGEGLA